MDMRTLRNTDFRVHVFRVDRTNHAVISARHHVSRRRNLIAVCAVRIARDSQRRDSDIQCDRCIAAVVALNELIGA
jgi:hypothetical protein